MTVRVPFHRGEAFTGIVPADFSDLCEIVVSEDAALSASRPFDSRDLSDAGCNQARQPPFAAVRVSRVFEVLFPRFCEGSPKGCKGRGVRALPRVHDSQKSRLWPRCLLGGSEAGRTDFGRVSHPALANVQRLMANGGAL